MITNQYKGLFIGLSLLVAMPGLRAASFSNVTRASVATEKPAASPGYRWVHPEDAEDTAMVWVPGSTDARIPHCVAQAEERHWRPAPGYRFLSEENDDLNVAW